MSCLTHTDYSVQLRLLHLSCELIHTSVHSFKHIPQLYPLSYEGKTHTLNVFTRVRCRDHPSLCPRVAYSPFHTHALTYPSPTRIGIISYYFFIQHSSHTQSSMRYASYLVQGYFIFTLNTRTLTIQHQIYKQGRLISLHTQHLTHTINTSPIKYTINTRLCCHHFKHNSYIFPSAVTTTIIQQLTRTILQVACRQQTLLFSTTLLTTCRVTNAHIPSNYFNQHQLTLRL